MNKSFSYIILFFVFLLSTHWSVLGQITASNAIFTEYTEYTSGVSQDPIYYFDALNNSDVGELSVQSNSQVTFEWDVYVEGAGFVFKEQSVGTSSTIRGLASGGYRVSYNEKGQQKEYIAWVVNDGYTVSSSISDSYCNSFQLNGKAVANSSLSYYDWGNNQKVMINPNYSYSWYSDDVEEGSGSVLVYYDPPAEDVKYTLKVVDRANLVVESAVTYNSIVPEASFSWSFDQKGQGGDSPQAPLEVTFESTSKNVDDFSYEWFLYKDNGQITEDLKNGANISTYDSTMIVLYDTEPIYTYKKSGEYLVKLAVSKRTDDQVCSDTVYIEEPIKIDSSFVSVMSVFTPNGDGINDQLLVKTRSVERLDFDIYNRWGRKVHSFHKDGYVPDDESLAAWDGKIGNKIAIEGVYFYVIIARGRDGVVRRDKGVIHLFD